MKVSIGGLKKIIREEVENSLLINKMKHPGFKSEQGKKLFDTFNISPDATYDLIDQATSAMDRDVTIEELMAGVEMSPDDELIIYVQAGPTYIYSADDGYFFESPYEQHRWPGYVDKLAAHREKRRDMK